MISKKNDKFLKISDSLETAQYPGRFQGMATAGDLDEMKGGYRDPYPNAGSVPSSPLLCPLQPLAPREKVASPPSQDTALVISLRVRCPSVSSPP